MAAAKRVSSTSAIATRVSAAAVISQASPRPPQPITATASRELGDGFAKRDTTGKEALLATAQIATDMFRSTRRFIRPLMVLLFSVTVQDGLSFVVPVGTLRWQADE